MAHYLPPAIMAFFQARPALDYKAPPNLHKKKNTPYSGVAAFVPRFADPPKPVVKQETPAERKAKHAAKVKKQSDERLKRQSARYDPDALGKVDGVTSDAMKTLFVGRLAFDVTEEVLRTEFDYYGPVKHVKLVKDKAGKSRGYAFVEFESSRHLKEAFKDADGRKINGRRILVDVERGRTVKGWKPRRLGGGLGGTRLGGKDVNQKYSGREPEGGAAAAAGAGAGRDDRSDYRRDDRDRGSGYDRRDDRRDDRYRDRRDDRGGYDRGGYDRDRRGGGSGYGGAAAAAAAPRARSRSRSPPHSGAARARSRERSRSRDRDGRRR